MKDLLVAVLYIAVVGGALMGSIAAVEHFDLPGWTYLIFLFIAFLLLCVAIATKELRENDHPRERKQ